MTDIRRFAAFLLDLDGVITSTADQHFQAWKATFDEILRRHAPADGAYEPFDRDDYNRHVDGLPRVDGVRNFLTARGIILPEGEPDDPITAQTVTGVGSLKNERVNEVIREQGVEVYPGSLALVRHLRERGVKTAVVSSSRNCAMILEVAGIADLFDARVDGVVAAELGLPGKPAPDTFLAAAERVGEDPAGCVVVEDALSGVEAGRDGGFGLVVGVDRVGQADALRAHGADVVVSDLDELLPEADSSAE